MNKLTLAILLLCLLEGLMSWWLWTRYSQQQGIISYLQANQRTIIFSMDSSCFDQFKNSPDGIIRLQIGKK